MVECWNGTEAFAGGDKTCWTKPLSRIYRLAGGIVKGKGSVFVIALLASSLGWQGQIAWGLEKLTVIYGAIGGGMWPVMVAEKRGIFVKNGLAITFVFVEGGSRAIPKARQAKAEDFIDNRFIRELDESGFIKGLYRR